jgi:hypothetical protein
VRNFVSAVVQWYRGERGLAELFEERAAAGWSAVGEADEDKLSHIE